MDRLRDKVVIITGASDGLGRVMATMFSAEGAPLVLAARERHVRFGQRAFAPPHDAPASSRSKPSSPRSEWSQRNPGEVAGQWIELVSRPGQQLRTRGFVSIPRVLGR